MTRRSDGGLPRLEKSKRSFGRLISDVRQLFDDEIIQAVKIDG